jgi:hypothetical protein
MNNTMLVLVSDHGNGYFYDNPFLALTGLPLPAPYDVSVSFTP